MHAELVRKEATVLEVKEFITSLIEMRDEIDQSTTVAVPRRFSSKQVREVVSSICQYWYVAWHEFMTAFGTATYFRESDSTITLFLERKVPKLEQSEEFKDFKESLEQAFKMNYEGGLISHQDWLSVELPASFSRIEVFEIVSFAERQGYQIKREVKRFGRPDSIFKYSRNGTVLLEFRPLSWQRKLELFPATQAEARVVLRNAVHLLYKHYQIELARKKTVLVYALPSNLTDEQMAHVIKILRRLKYHVSFRGLGQHFARRLSDGRLHLVFGLKAQGMVLVSAKQALDALDPLTKRQHDFSGFAPVPNFARAHAS